MSKIEITNECNMELMKRHPDNYFEWACIDPPMALQNIGGLAVKLN